MKPVSSHNDLPDVQIVCRRWAAWSSQFAGACFDQAKPFLDNDFTGIDPYVRFVSSQLFINCHLTSESVLILIGEMKTWDADVLARSVLEGTLKYVYMLLGNAKRMREKAKEYWEILPSFAAIKRSERIKRFLKDVHDPDNLEWQALRELVLKDTDVEEVRNSRNRTERREIEERWSFSGISKEFITSGDEGLRLLSHSAHNYGMSSHLLHKDGDGIGMVLDRYRRTADRQTVAELGHSARVVSDVCTFAQLRLLHLLKLCNKNIDLIQSIEKHYNLLFQELDQANQHFTQVEYSS